MTQHFIDAPDSAVEAIRPNHEDLSTLYPTAAKPDSSPWMREDERQAVLQSARDMQIAGLRRHAAMIGLYIALPFVFGMLILQLALVSVDSLQREGAMLIVFGVVLIGGLYTLITYGLFKRISEIFRLHNLKALPISLTVLISLFIISQPLFTLASNLVGGAGGYITALICVPIISIFLTIGLIYIWTSARVSPLLKLVSLVGIIGVMATIAFIARLDVTTVI
ncbi:hypothetical protein H7200_03215 [Candidatus Saccharibacteria bacterium]|nr:hypothetical protein [Candidatus Saccharibacteria bacterium]